MLNNINTFTYDVFLYGTSEIVTLNRKASECITKETTFEELEQICSHFRINSIEKLPELTIPENLDIDTYEFTRLAKQAIEVQNNKLLHYIVIKTIKHLKHSQKLIIFEAILDLAFISDEKEKQFYAYQTIKKLIQKINIRNNIDAYKRAIKTENVALICLLIKYGVVKFQNIKRFPLIFQKEKVAITAIQNLKYQLHVRNDFIEKALLNIDHEKAIQPINLSAAKLIVKYAGNDWLHDPIDRGIFIKYVIETVTSNFPSELISVILQYSDDYETNLFAC